MVGTAGGISSVYVTIHVVSWVILMEYEANCGIICKL